MRRLSGHTRRTLRPCGAVLLVVMAAGLAASAASRAAFSGSAQAGVLTGEWADAYERNYERDLPVRRPAAALWALLRYALFAEGARGVLVGTDGWLFTSEEFGQQAVEMDPQGVLETVRTVVAELESRGVALLIALVPAKARIYPDKLGRYTLPRSAGERYARARRELEALGIAVPDLAASLSEARKVESVFLRTDTHWTAAGARSGARALAAPARKRLAEAGSPRTVFSTRIGQEQVRKGDLLAFLPLGAFSARVGPQPDLVAGQTTAANYPTEVDLFGGITVPVVLVGTSYSAGDLWNFEGALKTELEADVVNAARQGQGPFRPMRDLLAGSVLEDVQADLVIWEIPERFLPLDWGPD